MPKSFLRSVFLIIAFGSGLLAAAQSTDQMFPTAITSNLLHGVIRARDIGDSRLTTYYYEFSGDQGDVFINVATSNLSGDVDIFDADENMKPLAKMTFYSDAGNTETGRVVYLRKGSRLILRVQGRTPDDSPATFQIKFAGSFVAMQPRKEKAPPTVSREDAEGTVRVTSAGAVVPQSPRPKPTPAPAVTAEKKDDQASGGNISKRNVPTSPSPATGKTEPERTRTVDDVPTVFGNRRRAVKSEPARTKPKTETPAKARADSRSAVEKPPADPMANIHLVIELKKGDLVERPMNQVLRFSVDGGILTVVSKDGRITRYSMLDVAKVTIQ